MPEEDLRELDSSISILKRNIDKLFRVFSIMKYVVVPAVDTWVTLEKMPPCAELCVETADFVQSFAIGLRIICISRLKSANRKKITLAKMKISKRDVFNPKLERGVMDSLNMKRGGLVKGSASDAPGGVDTEDEESFYNTGGKQWSSYQMGIATAFLRCYSIFNSFLDVQYGTRICPLSINPNCYFPFEFPFAQRLRKYLEITILIGLARVFGLKISEIESDTDKPISLPGKNSIYGVGHAEYLIRMRQLISFGQIGLLCLNTLKNMGVATTSVHLELKNTFEQTIFKHLPKNVSKETLGLAANETRDHLLYGIGNEEALSDHLLNVMDAISEENCNYFLTTHSSQSRGMMYCYPTVSDKLDKWYHLEQSSIKVNINPIYLVNKNSGEIIGDSKKRWNDFVRNHYREQDKRKEVFEKRM
jgi:hypothetical protein